MTMTACGAVQGTCMAAGGATASGLCASLAPYVSHNLLLVSGTMIREIDGIV